MHVCKTITLQITLGGYVHVKMKVKVIQGAASQNVISIHSKKARKLILPVQYREISLFSRYKMNLESLFCIACNSLIVFRGIK